VTVGADGSIAASPFEGDGPATAALLALRQTLTPDDRKRSVRDAMAYSASVGVTTHLDQGAFQATNTPADGSAHDNDYFAVSDDDLNGRGCCGHPASTSRPAT